MKNNKSTAQTFAEKIAKLIDVKSLMTVTLTGVFAMLATKGQISSTEFLDVFKLIVIFYFGTQAVKASTGEEKK